MQDARMETEEIRNVYRKADRLWIEYCENHKVSCPDGCDKCCKQFFPLWPPEVAIVREGLRQLSESVLRALRPLAAKHCAIQSEIYSESESKMPPDTAQLMTLPEVVRNELIVRYLSMLSQVSEPCVLLQQGCLIYPNRPLMCRLFGYPVVTQPRNLCETLMERYIANREPYAVVGPASFDLLTGAPHDISLRYRPGNPYAFRTVCQVVLEFLDSDCK